MITSVKTCYRSVFNHPFLVGMLCFLFFMYRSFPFLFSLLVSASPVLVCTAVLLGTLLSFGQPNIPEIEKEERITHDVASLKAGVVQNATIIKRNEDSVVERFMGREREVADRAVQEVVSADGKTSMVEEDDVLLETTRLIDDSPQENQGEKQVYEEAAKGFRDLEQENDASVHDEKSDVHGHEDGGHQYTLIQEEEYHNLERENGGIARDSTDAHLESPLGSKGKELDEEEDDDDMSVGSGSDHSESSSPDASMADIMPMLDELHPLLDVEAPQPAHLPFDDSDVASQHSSKSENGILESDEDNKNEEGEEEEEEEEESQRGKEDESKSVITWTEADQRNLMDLGTSELERNQRLENLIARRRARNLRTLTEKNLIDFDSDDLPLNVPSIATTRRNPFDGPDDSSYNVGLPPIPGSAPSSLLPRRNPFDIPYDPNEEKPDLKGDSFQQEFTTFHQRDTFFRRHESFSLGTSNFGVPRQEKQDSKWRPYFVPERFVSEGTSFHPMQRQSSEVSVSESKVSSIPDTESLSSNADQDDKRVSEHDSSQETEGISNLDQASLLVEHGSQSSEDADSRDIEDVEENVIVREEIEITLGNVDGQHVLEPSLPESVEPTDSLHTNENETQQEVEAAEEEYSGRSSSLFFSEVNETVADVKQEELVTSIDDLGEEPSLARGHPVEDLDFTLMAKAEDDNPHKEPVYDSSPPAVEKFLSFKSISSDVLGDVSEMTSTPDSIRSACVDKESEGPGEMLKEEPNYEEMFAAASQVHAENEDELSYREIAENAKENTSEGEQSLNDELGGKSESLVPSTESEHVSTGPSLPSWSESMGEDRISEHDSHNEHRHLVSSSFDAESPNWIQQSEGERQDSEQEEMHLSFGDGSSEAVSPLKDDSVHHEQLQVNSSAGSESSNTCAQHLSEHVDMEISLNQQVTFDDLRSSTPDDQPTSLANETISVIHEYSSSVEPESMKEHSFDKQDITQYVENQVQSSTSNAVKDADFSQDLEAKAVSHGSTYDMVPSENKLSELERQQSCSDKTNQPSIIDPNGEEELSVAVAEPVVEIISPNGINAEEMCEVEEKTLTDASTLTQDFSSNPDETIEYVLPTRAAESRDVSVHDTEIGSHGQVVTYSEQLAKLFESHVSGESMHEEVDDIKEIDEEFLRELDNVGDFRVKEADDDSKLLPGEASIGTYGSESTYKDPEPGEISLKLPVVEARSIEDVTMTFRKLHEGGDLAESILPCPIVNEQSINDSNIEDENTSASPIDDARSLQETHINTEHISEESEEEQLNIHKSKPAEAEADEGSSAKVVESDKVESGVSETRSVSFDDLTGSKEFESNPSLPVLEVKSLDDITMAFRQLNEGANVEEVIVPSSIGVQEEVDASEHRGGMNSGLHVVEARSLDDILVIMNQISEDNQEVTGKDMHYEDTEVSSTKTTESQSVGFSAGETRTVSFDKSVGLDEIQSSLSSPVHEERSVDVTMPVKQLDEGTDVEEVVHLHSTGDQQGIDESKLNSGLEFEKSSSDADHITVKQSSGGVQRGLPEDIHPEEKSTVAEAVTEVSSTETTESSKTQSGVHEPPAVPLEKTKDGCDGPSDASNLAPVSPRGER